MLISIVNKETGMLAMPKWVRFFTNLMIVIVQISILIAYAGFLWSLGYLYEGYHGDVAQAVLDSDDFLRYSAHHVTAGAMASFPGWPYVLLMAVGSAIGIGASIMFAKAMVKLLNNMVEEDYFSQNNIAAVKRLVVSQCYVVIGDFFIAGGNQLTSSWLRGYNNGAFPQTWTDTIDAIGLLIVLKVISVIYERAMTMKVENDLTV